ncbi:MAG TPA: hypothetical protein VLL52_22980, partial [Anaerolineae bacterium]|nr:hypothetical protein [Anaerolineae bacterium]
MSTAFHHVSRTTGGTKTTTTLKSIAGIGSKTIHRGFVYYSTDTRMLLLAFLFLALLVGFFLVVLSSQSFLEQWKQSNSPRRREAMP